MATEQTPKEAAETIWAKAQAIRQLSDAGYDRTSVVEAVNTNDLSKLKPNLSRP